MFPDFPDPTIVHHAVKHAHHAAKHVAEAAPIIKQGFSMITLMISNAIAVLVGAGLGWYVKGRGWFGVKMDANNAAKEIKSVASNVETAVAHQSN